MSLSLKAMERAGFQENNVKNFQKFVQKYSELC
jgi:hypothetical protein